MRRKSLLTAVFIIIGVLLVLLAGVVIYVNRVWIPNHGKALMENSLSTALGKDLSIDSVQYIPARGLVADRVTIQDDGQPIIVDSAQLKLSLGALLLSRKAVFKTHLVFLPEQPIHVEAKGTYDLTAKSFSGSIRLPDTPLIILHRLKELVPLPEQLTFRDGTADIRADIDMPNPQIVRVTGRIALQRVAFSWEGAQCAAELLIEPSFEVHPGTSKPVSSYTAHVNVKRLDATNVPSLGTASLSDAEFTVTPDRVEVARLHGTAGRMPWEMTGTYRFTQPEPTLDAAFRTTTTLDAILTALPESARAPMAPLDPKGAVVVTASLNGSLKQPDALLESARVTLTDASVGLPPQAAVNASTRLTGLNATLEYADQRVTIHTLTARLGELALTCAGNLALKPEPTLDATLESRVVLPRDAALLSPALQGQLAPYGLQGAADLRVALRGPLSRPADLVERATLAAKDVSATIPQLPDTMKHLRVASGTLGYEGRLITLTSWTGRLGESEGVLNGSVSLGGVPSAAPRASAAPMVTTLDLQADPLSCQTTVALDRAKNLVTIKQLKGQFGGNRFDVHGEVRTGHAPFLNLSNTTAAIDWRDLAARFPALQAKLAGLKLTGLTTHELLLRGPATDWRQWEADIKTKAEDLSIKDIPLLTPFLDVRLKNGVLDIPFFDARVSGGQVNARARMALTTPQQPFALSLQTNNVELKTIMERLQQQAPQPADPRKQKKPIAGQLTATLELEGLLLEKNSYRGGGRFELRNGTIFEKDLLGPVASILQQPKLSSIAFHEAYGSVTVQNQRVLTEDTRLISWDPTARQMAVQAGQQPTPQAEILVRGSVGFDQSLALNAQVQLSQQFVQPDSTLGQIASVLTSTPLLNTVEITGTVKQPKVRAMGGLAEPIQSIGGLFKDLLGR